MRAKLGQFLPLDIVETQQKLAIHANAVYCQLTVIAGPESHFMRPVGSETGFPQISD